MALPSLGGDEGGVDVHRKSLEPGYGASNSAQVIRDGKITLGQRGFMLGFELDLEKHVDLETLSDEKHYGIAEGQTLYLRAWTQKGIQEEWIAPVVSIGEWFPRAELISARGQCQ